MSKYARKPFPELFIDKVCNAALRNFLNWTPAQAQFCELRQIFRSSCFIEQVWITNSVVFTLENKSILKAFKAFKAFIKPFEAPQRSVKIKI